MKAPSRIPQGCLQSIILRPVMEACRAQIVRAIHELPLRSAPMTNLAAWSLPDGMDEAPWTFVIVPGGVL